MRRAPLTAMLTLLLVLATIAVLTGCGGKSGGSSTPGSTSSHHHKSPSY